MTISLNRIVSTSGAVISAVTIQAALIVNALTDNILLARDGTGTLAFNNATAVGAYFGTSSNEYMYASTYFKSYQGARQQPNSILFSAYVQSPSSAYIFSSQLIAGSTVSAIKALTVPVMTTRINSITQTLVLTQSDFSAATGLTDIATIIQTALDVQLTGCTCTIIGINQFSITAPSASAATTAISYCTGNVAKLLGLTADEPPTLSQGVTGGGAAYNMALIVNANPNWIALSYVRRLVNDTLEDGFAVTLDLTDWLSTQSDNYLGLWWEASMAPLIPLTSLTPASVNLATYLVNAGFGTVGASINGNQPFQITYNVAFQLDYNGVAAINSVTTDDVGIYSAFWGGIGASVNYNAINGKINFAGKTQAGLLPNVTNTNNYDILLSNGYNVYGLFASRSNSYTFTEDGAIGGAYLWIDNNYDSVWFTNQSQNNLAVLLGSVGRIAYNKQGIAQITAVLTNVIQSALANGVIETGNVFSATQTQAVIELVGSDITTLLTSNGYYIYFPPFTAQQRANRTPLFVYILYTNGGCVNQIALGQVFVA